MQLGHDLPVSVTKSVISPFCEVSENALLKNICILLHRLQVFNINPAFIPIHPRILLPWKQTL